VLGHVPTYLHLTKQGEADPTAPKKRHSRESTQRTTAAAYQSQGSKEKSKKIKKQSTPLLCFAGLCLVSRLLCLCRFMSLSNQLATRIKTAGDTPRHAMQCLPVKGFTCRVHCVVQCIVCLEMLQVFKGCM
jgi:hypothetical protein